MQIPSSVQNMLEARGIEFPTDGVFKYDLLAGKDEKLRTELQCFWQYPGMVAAVCQLIDLGVFKNGVLIAPEFSEQRMELMRAFDALAYTNAPRWVGPNNVTLTGGQLLITSGQDGGEITDPDDFDPLEIAFSHDGDRAMRTNYANAMVKIIAPHITAGTLDKALIIRLIGNFSESIKGMRGQEINQFLGELERRGPSFLALEAGPDEIDIEANVVPAADILETHEVEQGGAKKRIFE